MEELINKVTDPVIEQATSATVAMSLLVWLQEFVKIMVSGLEMHQLVKVSCLIIVIVISAHEIFIYNSPLP